VGSVGLVGNGVPPPFPSGDDDEQEIKRFKKISPYKYFFIFIK
jgi:hypothetical protein